MLLIKGGLGEGGGGYVTGAGRVWGCGRTLNMSPWIGWQTTEAISTLRFN